jgi:alpha-mannosidase
VRRSAELNQPPFALIETFHAGPLPQRASYVSDGGGGVVVTVVKGGEDGDAYVVRAVESAGRAARATITALGRTIEADFAANEIKTFLLPRGGGAAVEADLLES